MKESSGFLNRIAEEFLDVYKDDLYRIAFVFPTRRAGLYFIKYLQKKTVKSMWAPPVFSIKDFISHMSYLNESAHLELMFELYNVYKIDVKNFKKDFEDFYPWGKLIISDFNEIDKNLVDTEDLFRCLRELKDIEDIDIEEKPDIYKKYVGFWEDLENLYKNFRKVLKKKNRAYEGMLYRDVADNGEKSRNLEWEKVVFCGFNAFNRAEEKIIQDLINSNKAEIYWDMDKYFVDDSDQEAGHFFRENKKNFKLDDEIKWIDQRLDQEKKINIIGVQSKAGQAKVLGLKLKELCESVTDPEDIVVVLADESMLFPVLNSIPDSFDKVNITLGFPLKQTPVYSLLNTINEMHTKVSESQKLGKRGAFYFKDVTKLLNHPYIKPISSEEINKFIEKIKEKNQIYVKDIKFNTTVLNVLFEDIKNSEEILQLFLDILDKIRDFYSSAEGIFSIDMEFIYHFYLLLTRLSDSMKSSGIKIDIPVFWKLFNDIVEHTRIPFTGEPLEGLQIMGMLETQALNFKNACILSVNEGFLPPGKTHRSFIPLDVRKNVGLPTYKDRDAISSYHFYRLLKYSENINLIYAAESKGFEKNEKSRFIDQILIEYADKNDRAKIAHKMFDFSFEAQKIEKIEIEKSDDVIRMLLKKSYSATSLITYVTCPLKFYFTYYLNMEEEERIVESPDYKIFGKIIHKALEKLYLPYLNQKITSDILGRIGSKEFISSALRKVYKKETNIEDLSTGRNRIAFEVILELLIQFFDREKRNCNFKIIGLEKSISNVDFSFKSKNRTFDVKLKGFIDRIDQLEENYRIIDYKTGEIDSLNLDSINDLKQNSENRKQAFQLLFYMYLISRTCKDISGYKLGIYNLKKINEDVKYLRINKTEVMEPDVQESFEAILESIFQEIFDVSIPFLQAEEINKCTHCPYISICIRTV